MLDLGNSPSIFCVDVSLGFQRSTKQDMIGDGIDRSPKGLAINNLIIS